MKKFTPLKIFFFLFLFLFTSSCSKQLTRFLKNQPKPSASQIEDAKVWREKHLAPWPGQKILSQYWDQAWKLTTYGKEDVLVVPAPNVRVQNPDVQLTRFFLFTLKQDSVVNGRIVEIVGHEYNLSRHLNYLIKSYDTNEINNFDGSFLLYDINYRIIKSRTFKAGIIQPNTTTRFGKMTAEQLKKLRADTNAVWIDKPQK